MKIDPLSQSDIVVTCAPRLEEVISEELKAAGYRVTGVKPKTVITRGNFHDCLRLNLILSAAYRVLFKISHGKIRNSDDLYKKVYNIPWESVIPVPGYFSVAGSVNNPAIRDNRFAYKRAKDAIADRFQKYFNKRPDSGPDKSRLVINIFWENENMAIYLDTTGESLSKRGYRHNPFKAPLQETLAAAIIRSSKWEPGSSFVNPMCGSGTLAIEAALFLKGRLPGELRENFSFMHCKWFDLNTWNRIKRELHQNIGTKQSRIIASDIDRKAVKAARENAENAGVADLIEFQVCPFEETVLPDPPGTIIFNPEYGERLGDKKQLEDVYRNIGDFLKQKAAGYTAYIFTGNLDLAKRVGLRSSSRTLFYNGKIDCRLIRYDMFKGALKNPG